MQLLLVRIVYDAINDRPQHNREDQQGNDCPEQQGSPLSLAGHPWAKNSEISCDGIAPSRRTFHRASSSVKSTMVEEISRGDVPPSTMIGTRMPSCSRTAAAVVHSDSPLRLAEVAVIGMAAAFTTSSGSFALGTRRATLPVLAVTLSGSLEPAFTMMVSGPGQNFLA